jgi:glycine/D-amino acid oxidase-like deaminating enzyme
VLLTSLSSCFYSPQSLGKLSYALHAELAEELEGSTQYGYRKTPSLTMNVQRGQRGWGEELPSDPVRSWLNADNVSDIDVVDEDGTAQVHPEQFCLTLLKECERDGVKVVTGRAESVEGTEGGPSRIHHSNGTVTADSIVLCAGPWTGTLTRELFDILIPVTELAGHSVVLKTSRPIPPLAIFASVVDREGKSTTTPELFSRPDGTIYIAGENCMSFSEEFDRRHLLIFLVSYVSSPSILLDFSRRSAPTKHSCSQEE